MVVSEYNAFLMLEKSLRWLRGMSVKQVSGCNKLLHALRDDIEQGTTYRVRESLSLLGLKPSMNAKQIKAIMALSQESDLAFLWFTWEAFYNTSHELTDEREEYSANEQLLLSAIAHLDMKTTLRALDEILPTSEHSKKYQEMLQAKERREAKRNRLRREEKCAPEPFVINKNMTIVERDEMLRKARKRVKCPRTSPRAKIDENTLPYLIPQLRPKLYVPMPMISTPKDRQVIFPRYEAYKNKLYRIPNESRWFATYELSPVKRIVKHCIADALAPLFESFRKPNGRSACNVHRMLEFATARQQEELTIETTKRCLSLFMGERKNKQRQLCVVRQLERDVEIATQKLHSDARKQLAHLQRLVGGPCSVGTGCAMCGKLGFDMEYKDRPHRLPDFSFLLDYDFTVNAPLLDDAHPDEPVKVIELGTEKVVRLITPHIVRTAQNTVGSTAHCRQGFRYAGNKNWSCAPVEGLIKVLDSKGEVKKIVLPRVDLNRYMPEVIATDTPGESIDSGDIFCSTRTAKNGVLQWDYFKIYKPPEASESQSQMTNQLNDSSIIRSYCIAALKKAMERTSLTYSSTEEFEEQQQQQPQRQRSTRELFYGTAKERSSRLYSGMESSSAGDTSDRICHKTKVESFKRNEIIDPDDVVMLTKLLKIAIDVLKKDPKFVLVTLPNAHMMPVLIDWVAARYGKTYNYRQMDDLAKSMMMINKNLKHNSFHQTVPYPNMRTINQYRYIESFEKFEKYFCEVVHVQQEYFDRLNKIALQESRLIWLAMHGYSNLAGSITDTFFAYLPAKEADFVRHRLWDPHNIRDMVALRRRDAK
ncbi:hypothetical protein KR093_011129 [Drosophila rubida]|uniref:Uncharacterized protein n=1 Tax=Drosophila rubida TaxID=30044 RepID=A0AAD4PPC7_9MUSC|nr:hypothetical protein KR093_011129 [Drosophila rubida]